MEEKWLQEVSEKIKKKMLPVVKRNVGKIPYKAINGIYNDCSGDMVNWWTNGFWGGLMWLMYNATGNEEYKKTALKQESLLDEAFKNYDGLHHDVGFMKSQQRYWKINWMQY